MKKSSATNKSPAGYKLLKQHYTFLICLLLVLSTLAAFRQLRNCDFVHYDDNMYVTENAQVQTGITQQSVLWAFTGQHHSMWHPLTSLSHILDCQLFGLDPSGHHSTSLLFHIASTVLLFVILKRMTGAVWRSAFVAAAFALHPLNVESVAWISERKNVLSGFFWMLTIAGYIRYAERPSVGRYLAVVLALSMGLMSKPTVVTLPFVLLLLDWWPLGRLQWARQNAAQDLRQSELVKASYQRASPWRLVVEKIPLFILAAVLSVITFIVQQRGGAVKGIDVFPLKVRIFNAIVSYSAYIEKMFLPNRLAIFYPHPGDNLSVWQIAVAALVLLVISVWVIWLARDHKYLVVGWLWYLGTLVPVIGLVQVGGQAMADHYVYLPFIGLFIILSWGVPELLVKQRYRKTALAASALIALLSLSICTIVQVRYWRNSVALFEHALKVTSGNYTIHNNLCVVFNRLGRFDKSVEHGAEAVRIKPNYANAHYNLGIALFQQGEVRDAIKCWARTVQLDPNNHKAHNNLAGMLYRQGNVEQAIAHWTEALRLNPDDVKALRNLGQALASQGRVEEGIKHYSQALRIQPRQIDVHYELAVLLERQGRLKEAIREYREVLRLAPNHAEAKRRLDAVLKEQSNSSGQSIDSCPE